MSAQGGMMPGKNSSMSSSNTSFYFQQQHGMPGLVGPGAPPPPPPSNPGAPHPGAPPGAPVAACHYTADATDPIDVMLTANLATLDPRGGAKLMLRRLGGGRYEIDGRRVNVRWADLGGAPGLLACEAEVADVNAAEMPLSAYLSQAANVAASLSGQRDDMPKIARVPKEQRLTFADASAKDSTAGLKLDSLGNERCESMRIACEQAMLREQAAEAYERKLQNPFVRSQGRSLNPPRGLLH